MVIDMGARSCRNDISNDIIYFNKISKHKYLLSTSSLNYIY